MRFGVSYFGVRNPRHIQQDLDDMVRIDRHETGQERRGYYRRRLKTVLEESGIRVSLAAEIDGLFVGFVLGRVYHGEFGHTDSFASLDSIGVDPGFRSQGVGHALLHQLLTNLRALHIESLQTEVDWDDWDLLRFFKRTGFEPAPRLSLEMRL